MGMPMYNAMSWQMPTWNTYNTSYSSSDTSSTSDDEIAKKQKLRREEEEKKAKARIEENQLISAKSAYLREFDEEKIKISDSIELIEKSKTKSGGAVIRENSKEMTTGQKFMRWVSNGGTALMNLGKAIIGYDQDGNWDIGRCIKNVAITAGAIGACFLPVVGPIIATGLAVSGVVAGVAGAIKQGNDLSNAKTEEEIDKAQQGIISNGATALLSLFGLKGIGASASTATTTAQATSITGRIWNAISNFGKDITVNTYRATKSAVTADKALIASEGGYFKAYGAKVSNTYKDSFSWENKYNKQRQELEQELQNKITDLNSKISAETNATKKALLQQQKEFLELNQQELRSIGTRVKSKSELDKLLTENSSTFNDEYLSLLENEARTNGIGGHLIGPKRFKQFSKQVKTEQKNYASQLKQLLETRECMMRTYASKPLAHKDILDDYVTPAQINRHWYKPSTWRQNGYQVAIGGKNPGQTIKLLSLAAISPELAPVRTDASLLNPIYSTSILAQEMSPEEVETQLKALEEEKKSLEDAKKYIRDIKTIDEWNIFLKKMSATSQQENIT